MRWLLMDTPPWTGAANMAADCAMLDRASRTGEALARVYAWRTPTVSFGRHQRARGVYDLSLIAADGFDVVRRPTGGRAILHARELTYAVAMPTSGPLRESHAAITRLVAAALDALGVSTSPAASLTRATRPGAAPCFDAPADGELVVDGAKLVGSAQVRRDGALLQHGSILIDNDQTRLTRYLLVPARDVPAPQTLRGILGRAPSVAEFAQALAGAIAAESGGMPDRVGPSVLDAGDIRRHVATFRDPAWTWGR